MRLDLAFVRRCFHRPSLRDLAVDHQLACTVLRLWEVMVGEEEVELVELVD